MDQRGNEPADELAHGQTANVAGSRQSVTEAMAVLSEQERDLLTDLFGLGQQTAATLEEVAEALGHAPEEVGAMRTRAIRRLRHPKALRLIVGALEAAGDDLWLLIARTNGVVYKTELRGRFLLRVPGEFRLAMECCYGSVEPWLSENAKETSRIWYRSEYTKAQIQAALQALERFELGWDQPYPAASAADLLQLDSKLVALAVALSEQITMYRGYIMKRDPRSRSVRCARLHEILAGDKPAGTATILELVEEYCRRYADDACTVRDADAVMSSATALFLRLGDLGWTALGPDIGARKKRRSEVFLLGEDELDTQNLFFRKGLREATAARVLNGIFETRGMSRVSTFMEAFRQQVGDRYTVSSVWVALATDGGYRRVAPGVYDLTERARELDPVTATSKLLLTQPDCRLYVQARYAGEPMGAFPLWTPAMERDWCWWAERMRYTKLLDSLLFVAEPAAWPAAESEKTLWLWKKRVMGRFRLDLRPRYPKRSQLPTPRDLLAVMTCAGQRGTTNWLIVNRITGERLHQHAAATSLAILVAAECLAAPADWRRAHDVGPRMEAVAAELSEEMHRTGSLGWDRGAAGALLERLPQALDRAPLGWVQRRPLEQLVELLREEALTPRHGAPPATPGGFEEDEETPLGEPPAM